MTTLTRLHSRLDALEEPRDGDRFALEIGDHAELDTALAQWRRHHRTDPLMILVVPERQYQPDYPTPRGRLNP